MKVTWLHRSADWLVDRRHGPFPNVRWRREVGDLTSFVRVEGRRWRGACQGFGAVFSRDAVRSTNFHGQQQHQQRCRLTGAQLHTFACCSAPNKKPPLLRVSLIWCTLAARLLLGAAALRCKQEADIAKQQHRPAEGDVPFGK